MCKLDFFSNKIGKMFELYTRKKGIRCLLLYLLFLIYFWASYLKRKSLIKFWIKRLPVHFGFEFFLLVRQKINLNIRIGSAAHVESWKVLGFEYRYGQTVRIEVVFQLKSTHFTYKILKSTSWNNWPRNRGYFFNVSMKYLYVTSINLKTR